jgi:hypothetical protein
MIETEMVPKTSVSFNHPTRAIAREFMKFSLREIFEQPFTFLSSDQKSLSRTTV